MSSKPSAQYTYSLHHTTEKSQVCLQFVGSRYAHIAVETVSNQEAINAGIILVYCHDHYHPSLHTPLIEQALLPHRAYASTT